MTTRRDIPYNSIVAYHELHDLDERQAAVFSIVAECPGVSSPEVFSILRHRGHKVQENSVTPRLKELVDQDRIKVTGSKINRRTGRKVYMYEVVA